jgi:hypothetical protein
MPAARCPEYSLTFRMFGGTVPRARFRSISGGNMLSSCCETVAAIFDQPSVLSINSGFLVDVAQLSLAIVA